MPTINAAISSPTGSRYVLISWPAMTSGDDGEAYEPNSTSPLAGAIQFTGTFGAAIVLQGSNDGTNWVTINDLLGNPITTAAAAIFEFSTSVRYIRPTPGAVTSVDVLLVLRG